MIQRGSAMEVERNGAETVQAEDNGYVGSEDRSKAANDGRMVP